MNETVTRPVIYRTDTLKVELSVYDPDRHAAEGCELVTFEPLERKPNVVPFGARFAARYGLNALHIVPIGADWYQYPDLHACLAFAEEKTAKDAVIYGSSMGAFAATTYGDAFPGRKVIALSPQYSIRPELVPFERRWLKDAERIAFLPGDENVTQLCHNYVFYDPLNPDATHARMIAERGPTTLIEVSGGGHPVGMAMVEAGILSSMVLSIMRGSPTGEELDATIRANITKSPLHYYHLASQHPEAREAYLRQGLELSPGHIRLRHLLAMWLRDNQRLDEALEHYEYVVRRRPFHPRYREQYIALCEVMNIAPQTELLEAGA